MRKFVNLAFAAADFLFGLRVGSLHRRNGIAQTHNIVIQVVEFDGRGLHLALQLAVGILVLADVEFLFLDLGLEFRRLRLRSLNLVFHTARRRIEGVQALVEILVLVEADRKVQFTQALGKLLVFLHLLGLRLVLAHRAAGRPQVVFHTGHVRLDSFQLAHGLLPLLTVLAHAGSLFKQHTAVIRLVGENRLDHVGVHLRVRAGTETRVKEQGMHVAQAALLVVDEVFAGTVPVDAAGNDNLGIFGRKRPIAVVDNDGNFGKAHGGTFFRTAENHVLHLAHTQERGPLFAEHPADGVGNVRLAAPVRAHDGGKALRGEVDFCPLGKGLESKNLKLCYLHCKKKDSKRELPELVLQASILIVANYQVKASTFELEIVDIEVPYAAISH